MNERTIESVERRDVLDHVVGLQRRKLSERTICNQVVRINALLRSVGKVKVLESGDWPKYEEREVTAYTSDELASLLIAASPDEAMLFNFFLATGIREQEVMHCSWSNVDFRSRVIRVRSQPDLGFRIKDKEQRSVPVPDWLIDALSERKTRVTSGLIFGNAEDNPDGYLLRRLQRLAHRAKLNCSECVEVQGRNVRTLPLVESGVFTSFDGLSRSCTQKAVFLFEPFRNGSDTQTSRPPSDTLPSPI